MKNDAAKRIINHIISGDINSAFLQKDEHKTIELTQNGELLIETANGYKRTWCNQDDIEDEIQKLIDKKVSNTIRLLRVIKIDDILE
ncbi:MAG: hypothetical protein KFKLKKLM_02457 [Flavobacteriales bacterium]|nr:hypothetical protein [Flavobacteriales bacterium]